jgi:hypothetical protein
MYRDFSLSPGLLFSLQEWFFLSFFLFAFLFLWPFFSSFLVAFHKAEVKGLGKDGSVAVHYENGYVCFCALRCGSANISILVFFQLEVG